MDTQLLARATRGFAEVLGQVRPGHADLPSPCAGWSVRALIGHVVSEYYVFGTAVAQSQPADSTRPENDSTQPDNAERLAGTAPLEGTAVLGAYRDSSHFLLAGFAEVPDGAPPVAVPGLPGERPPADLYEMQIADTLIHTWDLATAIGAPITPDPEVLELALRRMRQVPEQARGDGRPFGAALVPAADTAPLDTLLRLAGRDPNQPLHP
jgi:uncharacterized protein (TIGR03086 family)